MKIGKICFIIAAAHLVDRMSSADPEPRLVDIRKMMDVIHGYENALSINKTIVMGDLNAIHMIRSYFSPTHLTRCFLKG